jgi:hypothetical protein
VTSSGPDDDPKDNTAAAPVVVRQPTLDLDPGIGPPGFVARVLGRDFPPGGVVRLAWSVGISEIPGEVTVRPDGTIDAQALVFHKDLLGPRTLLGSWVRGSRFGTVASVRQFLVVPRTVQPPAFVAR